MHNKESLESLFWQMAVNDNVKALEQLFLEFYPALCVFAKQYIDNEETCRDIVQDTFFKIWQKRKQISIERSFRSFLVTSVRNSCIDHIRKKQRSSIYEDTQRESILSVSPEDVYILNELQQVITTAIQQLPGNIRQAFELSRFQDKTYIEIAGEMNVSLKTVESYISRALKILRHELKDYLPFVLLFLH